MGLNTAAARLLGTALSAATFFAAAGLFAEVAPAEAQQPRSSRRPTTATNPTAKPVAPVPTTKKPAAAQEPTKAPVPPQPKREPVEAPKTIKPTETAQPLVAPVPITEPKPKPVTAPTPKSEPKAAPKMEPTLAPPKTDAPAAIPPIPPIPTTPVEARSKPRTTELFAPPPLDGVTNKNEKYLFRYQFSAGETVRWQVEHKAKIATTVEGTTQTAETQTRSIKAWKVVETQPGGETVFVHMVESIDMRQKLSGRQETHYDSTVDEEVPPIFQQAATQVGIPLAELTIDNRGKVLKRLDDKHRAEGAVMTDITLILPDKPLAIGESSSIPFDMSANDKAGNLKVIKARKKITLESVSNNIAVLKHETQILSPLKDPAIEAQVVQSEQSGTVKFDIAKGRIVSIEMTNDREVFGFQGDASVMHITASFSEQLSDGPAPPHVKTAAPAPNPDDKTAAKPETTSKK